MHKRLSLHVPNNRAQKLMRKRLNCRTDSFTNMFLMHLIRHETGSPSVVLAALELPM